MLDSNEESAEKSDKEAASHTNTDPNDKFAALNLYMRELKKYPVLPKEEFNELHARWQKTGDPEAFNLMVYSNSRLVITEVRHYLKHGGLGALDMMQEGFFGMMRAVERFEPARGFKFSTFAVWWIRHMIKRGIQNNNEKRPYRLPVQITAQVKLVAWAMKEFQTKYGRWPSDEEAYNLIHANDGTDKETSRARKLTRKDLVRCRCIIKEEYDSLDSPVASGWRENSRGERAMLFHEVVMDRRYDNEAVAKAQQLLNKYRAIMRCVEAEVNKLNPREAMIMRLRLGLGEFEKMTFREISERHGITKQRVLQIERKMLKNLEEKVHISTKEIRDMVAAIDALSQITGEEHLAADNQNHTSDGDKVPLSESDLKEFFELLCEHLLVTPSGSRIIKAPLQVLKIRSHLLPNEAKAVLEGLRQRKLVAGKAPWSAVTVIPEDVPIPTFGARP